MATASRTRTAAPASAETSSVGQDEHAEQAARITSRLAAIAKTGANPDGSISRLAFTSAERAAHDLVGDWLKGYGLSVSRDTIGNTIAELPGQHPDLPAIAVGSHLDSVPFGGRYDGIAGIVAALEVVDSLTNSAPLQHPLRVVCFVGEEGARFGEPCIGSKAVAGLLTVADLERIADSDGVTLARAMAGVGLTPNHVARARWSADEWAAFLELHVEQARTLDDAHVKVGLVDGVSGSTRLRLTIHGRADHSGGTPMSGRVDAFATAAEIALFGEQLANDARHRGTRVTVGYVQVFPNSLTTIPGRAVMTVDVRDVDSDRQRKSAEEIVAAAAEICTRRGAELVAEVIADTSPVVLPIWVRSFARTACVNRGIEPLVMASGASHDAQVVNSVVPAGMIFVPSRNGLSHVPEEWTSSADIATGANVLTETVRLLDAYLARNAADAK
jgi:hydantoinase/carbamoylase family amidase